MSETFTELVVPCLGRTCAADGDFTTYNLQDALLFNGTPLSRIMVCPPGYYCSPGSFPRTVTYPPGTFSIPYPPPGGNPIVIRYQGCQSLITRVLAAGSSAAAIHAAADEVFGEAADQQALCDAINTAGPRLPQVINLSSIADPTCVDVFWSETIVAIKTPSLAPYTFSSPDLPAWITATTNTHGTATTLSGTPPAIGNYTFTITVASSSGVAQGSKTYTVQVVGIAESSPLTSGTEGVAYLEVLTAPSIPGALTWALVSGAFPAGVGINPNNGNINGTPSEDGVFNVGITVTNGSITCSKAFQITIDPPSNCPDWTSLSWTAPTLVGSSTAAMAGDLITLGIQDALGVPQGVYNGVGSLTYNGTGCNCRITTTILTTDPIGFGAWVIVTQNGFTITSFFQDFTVAGVFTHDFSIGNTFGSNVAIEVLGGEPALGQQYWVRAGGFFNSNFMSCTIQLTNLP